MLISVYILVSNPYNCCLYCTAVPNKMFGFTCHSDMLNVLIKLISLFFKKNYRKHIHFTVWMKSYVLLHRVSNIKLMGSLTFCSLTSGNSWVTKNWIQEPTSTRKQVSYKRHHTISCPLFVGCTLSFQQASVYLANIIEIAKLRLNLNWPRIFGILVPILPYS